MFNKKSLKNNLRNFFTSRIFSRGVEYYNGNCVESLKVFPAKDEKKIKIMGEVAGSDYYNANMSFDLKNNKFSGMDCDCPYDDNCKHLAALGLEFIELSEKFYSDSGFDFDNDKNFKEKLISWTNNLKKARNYKGYKDESYAYDYAENDDFYDDKELDRREAIADRELEEKIMDRKEKTEEQNNFYAGRTREELMEELKVWASTGGAPGGAIDGVIHELALRSVDYIGGENKQNINPPAAPAASKTEKIKQKKEFDPAEFQMVIQYDYGFDIHIHKGKNKTIGPSQIFQDYSGFSKTQKQLFKFIKKFYTPWKFSDNIDYGELFNLIKHSGLKIFKQRGYHWNIRLQELFFAEKPEKIKAELILKKHNDLSYGYIKHAFVFKLNEIYEFKDGERNNRLFFGNEYLTYISANTIHFYKIPSILIKIISRVELRRSRYYGYGDNFLQIALEDDEIINLNQVINDGKKYLDLKTNLKADYNIQKFNKSDKCIAVDFDHSKESLEVKPAIDYGFCLQNVSETIYYAKGKYNRGFKRREYKYQDKYAMEINDKSILYAPLAIKKEIDLFKNFYNQEQTGFTKTLKCGRNGEKQIFEFFKNHWPEVKKIADKNGYKIIFTRDEFSFAEENFRADFNVGLDAENDWLWFDVNCYGGKDKISLEDLKKYVEDKKEFIKMDDGRFLKIANFEELERFVMMLESFYAREQGGGFEGKLYHAPELENIFTSSKYYNAQVENSFNKFIKEAKSGKPVKKVKLKPRFNKIMRDYQKTGVDWFYFLRKYRFAGVLADDMGLGKTLQALALVEMERKQNKPSIVICPKSILYNWKAEAEKFAPNLKAAIVDGFPAERKAMIKAAKKSDLIITGYATMQKDAEAYEKEKIKFNYCILDEAQFIKNHTTKNARIVKKINADYRLALTGTPLENNVSEIWSIFDFLMPGFLGSYKVFVKKFQNPIMKRNNAAALDNLRKKVECFMLRRVKGEVLKELPPKIEQVSHCHLEKAQNILYQEILANVKSEIFTAVSEKGFNQARIHILAGLMKLRQVCNHPVLLLKDKNYTKYESAKLNMFTELIDEIVGNKKKVLVFSQFTKMLDILSKELEKKEINYNYLSGQTKNRQELVDDFNNNIDKQVFLISLKAGGTGLNLTAADNVIIFDPWWNPSVENQAIDRAHRIGQKNSVNVYRLITLGTIEEKIVKLQERKKFLFDSLVGESKDLFQKLTWEDVQDLFK